MYQLDRTTFLLLNLGVQKEVWKRPEVEVCCWKIQFKIFLFIFPPSTITSPTIQDPNKMCSLDQIMKWRFFYERSALKGNEVLLTWLISTIRKSARQE